MHTNTLYGLSLKPVLLRRPLEHFNDTVAMLNTTATNYSKNFHNRKFYDFSDRWKSHSKILESVEYKTIKSYERFNQQLINKQSLCTYFV